MSEARRKGTATRPTAREHNAEDGLSGTHAGITDQAVLTRQSLSALDHIIPANLFLFDDARIQFANSRACELVGFPLPALSAKGFWQLITPDSPEAVKARDSGLQCVDDFPPRFQARLLGRDGRSVWMDFSARVVNYEGGKAILAFGHDISRQTANALALRDRIAFEDVVRSISTGFIHLLPSEVDRAIHEALRKLGEYADVDRSYVFMFSDDGEHVSNTHEWCGTGIASAINDLQEIPTVSMPWFFRQISRGDVVYVPDVSALPPEAAPERAEFERESIQSLVCVPIVADERVSGFVGFDSVRNKKSWPPDIIQLLRDLSQILANAFHRQKTADLTATNVRLQQEVDERQRVEGRLREQGELLQNIIANIPHSVFWKNRDSVFLGCNQNFAVAAGFNSPEEIVGKTDFDMAWRREESEFFVQCDRDVMESGAAMLNIEEPQLQADGTEATLLTSKVPLRNVEGQVVGVLGIFAEITELKKTEAALRESEQRLQGILENTPAVVFVKDLTGRYILVNRRFAEVANTDISQAIGKSDPDFFPDDVVQRFRRNDLTVLETGTALETEEVVPMADGLHTFYSLKFPLCDEGQKPYAVCGISTDMSARKRAEEALLHRMQLEETISMCSQTLLATDDMATAFHEALETLRSASSASCVCVAKFIQSDRTGWQIRCTHEVFEGEIASSRKGIDQLTTERMPQLGEWHMRLSKGEAIRSSLETSVAAELQVLENWGVKSVLILPIRIKDGLYGFLRFDNMDMTRTWKEEDVRLLATAADMIGTFVEKRRAQAELRVAKEAAESANQAKSRLLANLSHEIRTPITAMLGAAELSARDESGGFDRAQRTDMILSSGRHLLALVDNLLDLSKIEANIVSMEMKPCSLVDFVADVRAITLPLCTGNEIEFKFCYDSALPSFVQTDATRLKQAVINLVSNALKFTDEGFVHVRFSTRDASEGYQLVVIVEDTGIGIPHEDLDLVFESFQRAEHLHGRVVGGVGLGLPLARWIANRLGGTLELQTEEGAGSSFTLAVEVGPVEPLEWIHPVAFGKAVDSRSNRMRPTLKKKGLRGRVLLAEDVEDVRLILQSELQAAGADVTAVGDGFEAVRMAKIHEYDLILMDLRMPHMDGRTATRKLREGGFLSPIIALTALSTQADMAQLAEVGFDDCWAKPISLTHLVEAAGAYLRPADDAPDDQDTEAPAHELGRQSTAARFRLSVRAFESSLPDRLADFRAATARKDRSAIFEALHQLAGSGGTCGHMELSEQAKRVMDIHASHDWSQLLKGLHDLELLIEQIMERGSESAI